MIEIFRTDVQKQSQADLLANLICLAFTGHEASFDLEDCDKVLRIVAHAQPVCCESIIDLLANFGYSAQVLEENILFTSIHLNS